MSKTVTYIKTSSISRKFAQLIAAVILLIVTLNIWVNIDSEGDILLEENALVLADNILLQTAHSASRYIEKDDIEALEQLTDSALRSDYIHEMLIYDERGVVLSQSTNALSTKERFLTQIEPELVKASPSPFVAEIRNNNNELQGFVRITLLRQQLQKDGVTYIDAISKKVLLLSLFAGLIGYLLTIGLRPFSANAFVLKE